MAKIKSGFPGERAIILPEKVINEYRNDPMGILLHITDLGFYPKAGYHHRTRKGPDVRQFVLMYCVDGEGWIELQGNKNRLCAGEVVILPRNETHSYGSSSQNPWTIYWIHFDGTMAPYFAFGIDKPLRINADKDSRIKERLDMFEDIFSVLKNGYSHQNMNYCTTVLFHFLGSIKFLASFRSGLSEHQNNQNPIDDAIHFMRENIHRPLTLKEVAAFTGFSVSHFSMVFKHKTGYAPLNYFNRLRVQEACHYLDFSAHHINQIAMMTGFTDPFYFSRIFNKVMGCSPSTYRLQKKG